MTSPRRFDGDLPVLLADLYLAGTPDYRDDVVQQIARVRQRPAWTFPERWLSMELVTSRVPATRMPWRQIGVLALLAVLLATALAVYVGSNQHRLPPPFGLAANGRIAFVTTGGDIAVADPVTGFTTTVVTGTVPATSPTYSLDGSRIAFVRQVGDAAKVYIVDSGGGGQVEIASAPPPIELLSWSPDGSRLAFLSSGTIWIAQADGSASRRFDFGLPIQGELAWRPPDGRELVFKGQQGGKTGLFVIKPDLTLRPLTPVDGEANDYGWVSFAPDGRRIAYSNTSAGQIHVVIVDGPQDTLLEPEGGLNMISPRWSPDGTRLAFVVVHPDRTTQIGVADANDAAPAVTLTGPRFKVGIEHRWSPDGERIVAVEWETTEPWLLDPAGGPGTRLNLSASFPDTIEWQRLAR